MVASRRLEFPFYKGIGGQRGRGFGALAQGSGRTAVPLLCIYVVPLAKRVGADLLELALPKIADVVNGRKNFDSCKEYAKTNS